MRTPTAVLASFAIAQVLASAEPVKVPDRTPTQRYNRLLQLDVGPAVLGIAFAKLRGATVDEYGRFCGEQFAPSWNKDNGFAGLARGAVANFDIFRRDEDLAVEILAQSDTMIRFKSYLSQKRSFRDGKLYGVTFEEYARWLETVYVQIAAAFGATYKHELSGDFFIVTIAKK